MPAVAPRRLRRPLGDRTCRHGADQENRWARRPPRPSTPPTSPGESSSFGAHKVLNSGLLSLCINSSIMGRRPASCGTSCRRAHRSQTEPRPPEHQDGQQFRKQSLASLISETLRRPFLATTSNPDVVGTTHCPATGSVQPQPWRSAGIESRLRVYDRLLVNRGHPARESRTGPRALPAHEKNSAPRDLDLPPRMDA